MNEYRFDSERHIHLLNERPIIGTTTALGVISKPLTWWASQLACEQFGFLNPKNNPTGECDKYAQEKLDEIRKMSLGEYRKLLDRAYRAHATKLKDSAGEGRTITMMPLHGRRKRME